MSGIASEHLLVGSVLDRLIGRPGAGASAAGGDRPPRRGQSLAELKQALRRDLENLLNTRAQCGWAAAGAAADDADDADDANDVLARSLANYGLPDFTSANLGDPAELEALRRTIEVSVRRFEPRLCGVRVTLDPAPLADRTLRFRINALLRVEPAAEPVQFETALEPGTATFLVKGGGRG